MSINDNKYNPGILFFFENGFPIIVYVLPDPV